MLLKSLVAFLCCPNTDNCWKNFPHIILYARQFYLIQFAREVSRQIKRLFERAKFQLALSLILIWHIQTQYLRMKILTVNNTTTTNLLRACQVSDIISRILCIINSFTPHYNISHQWERCYYYLIYVWGNREVKELAQYPVSGRNDI